MTACSPAFAWDNIDSRLVSNVQRIFHQSIDFHGTILISAQMHRAKPLVSSLEYRQITLSRFPNPRDLLLSVSPAPIRDFKCLTLALVVIFRENLMSLEPDKSVSLDFLLKTALVGSNSGKPCLIRSLAFEDSPSNSPQMAENLMSKVVRLVERHSSEADGGVRMATLTADQPLFAQMQKIIHDAPKGERNPAYKTLVPLLGMMHTHMAMQDTVKRLVYDSCLDALALHSGLSDGMQAAFRDRNEYKSSHLFFEQCLAALICRIWDVLLSHGPQSPSTTTVWGYKIDGLQLLPCQLGAGARRMDAMNTIMLSLARKRPVNPSAFSLDVNPDFVGRDVLDFGRELLREIESFCSDLGDPNFAFFAGDVVLNFVDTNKHVLPRQPRRTTLCASLGTAQFHA